MSKPKFFMRDPRPGLPLSARGIAAGLRNMAYAIENMSVHNGHIAWGPDGVPKIIVEALEPAPASPPESAATELDVSVSGTTFTIAPGQWMHGVAIDFAGDTGAGSSASVDDERWVGVAVDFGSPRTAVGFMTDDSDKKPDENSTAYFHLSLWKRTATSWTFVRKSHPFTEQHGIMLR